MRRIILCCGLTTGGKTFWARRLGQELLSNGPELVDLDEVRIAHFGRGRKLTDEEHLVKNELFRAEVKKRFVSLAAELVIASAPMLTIERHQRPFVQLAQELGAEVVALWFTCDEGMTRRRLERRKEDPNTICTTTDWEGFMHGFRQFEPPALYPTLRVDTTDETEGLDAERLRRIMEFLSAFLEPG